MRTAAMNGVRIERPKRDSKGVSPLVGVRGELPENHRWVGGEKSPGFSSSRVPVATDIDDCLEEVTAL